MSVSLGSSPSDGTSPLEISSGGLVVASTSVLPPQMALIEPEQRVEFDDERVDPAHTTTDAERPIRHALEVRHESFVTKEFPRLLRDHDIPAIGVWAQVPHYVAAMPYPAASLALLQATNRIVQVGTQRRSSAFFKAAGHYVRSGALGQITRVETLRRRLDDARDDLRRVAEGPAAGGECAHLRRHGR